MENKIDEFKHTSLGHRTFRFIYLLQLFIKLSSAQL